MTFAGPSFNQGPCCSWRRLLPGLLVWWKLTWILAWCCSTRCRRKWQLSVSSELWTPTCLSLDAFTSAYNFFVANLLPGTIACCLYAWTFQVPCSVRNMPVVCRLIVLLISWMISWFLLIIVWIVHILLHFLVIWVWLNYPVPDCQWKEHLSDVSLGVWYWLELISTWLLMTKRASPGAWLVNEPSLSRPLTIICFGSFQAPTDSELSRRPQCPRELSL